ncbi:deacetylase [Klebsiella pneumoniae]|uniref:Deacetylase n=1 Tax=Klebsiella pneumoniae TaxID=573 RepID=A0A4P0XY43_KLEPN|nr:deacetylase [Klebsiella pneumoniae]
MKRKTGFFFDERCFWHSTGLHAVTLPVGGWVQPPAGGGHAESPETKRRMKNLMDVSGLTPQLALRSAAPASLEDLRRIHPDSYLERFKAISDNGGGMLGKEAPLGPGSYEIACLSAGLACAAVEAVLKGELDNAYSLSRRPDTTACRTSRWILFPRQYSHCRRASESAAGLGKVAIIDWDVHHGNGTQHIYLQRDDVLTISLHQDGCFPPGYAGEDDRGVGAGEGYNINIPLLAGAGDDSWRYALETIVIPALARFEPELIIIACGYDANAMDPLARMQLHSDSFRAMTEQVQQAADRLCGGKLVMVHEGGYAESYVPFCGLAVMEALSGIRTEVQDPLLEFIQQQQPRAAFAQFQREAIDRLAQQFGLL